MIEAEPLRNQPQDAASVDEWTPHHRLLYRLAVGAAGSTTEEIQLLYDAVAPVAYQGLTVTPVTSRRYRRGLLTDLAEEGVVEFTETPRGRVWLPTEDVVDDPELADRFGGDR